MIPDWIFSYQKLLSLALCFGSVGVLSFVFSILFPSNKVRGLPHPKRLPFIGNLWCLDERTHECLFKLSTKLGGRYKLFLGSTEVVVLSSFDVIKDTLVNSAHNFNSRPLYYSFSLPPGGRNLSFEPFNNKYLFLRKTAVGTLKIPFQKCPVTSSSGNSEEPISDTVLEAVVCREIQQLFNDLPPNKAVESSEKMAKWVVMRSTCLFFTGAQLEGEYEKEAHNFLHNIDSFAKVIPWAALADNNPLLHYILLPKIHSLQQTYQRVSDFVIKLFEVCTPDSIFSKLITTTSLCPHDVTEFEVLSIGTQLIGAMIPTTSRTLQWVILFLLNRPTLLSKVRTEILTQGEVSLKSKMSNVYLNAVIYETLRFITPTPISVPRAPAHDVSDGKVFIPKDTPVLVNLWAANHDKGLWKFPNEFNIGNFLSEDMTSLNNSAVENLMSFSVGRRRCLGEKLAYSFLFMAVGKILEKFSLGKITGQGDYVSEAQHVRLDVVPSDFSFRFIQ